MNGSKSLEKIKGLNTINVNSMIDSELERRFIEAFRQMNTEARQVTINQEFVQGTEGYILKVNDSTWEITPQYHLSNEFGVTIDSKPDFIIWPLNHYSTVMKYKFSIMTGIAFPIIFIQILGDHVSSLN